MALSLIYLGLCRVLVLVASWRRSGFDKDVEIVVLRHQVRVLERQLHGRVRYRPAARAILAALSRLLPRARWRCFLVTPDTLLRWHRELAKRKWRRWRAQRGPGRPPMTGELVELVIRLGRENRSWGCVRIQGELRKLGIRVSASSIRRVLRRHGLGPGPRSGPTWSEFLRVQAHSVLAMCKCGARCSQKHHERPISAPRTSALPGLSLEGAGRGVGAPLLVFFCQGEGRGFEIPSSAPMARAFFVEREPQNLVPRAPQCRPANAGFRRETATPSPRSHQSSDQAGGATQVPH